MPLVQLEVSSPAGRTLRAIPGMRPSLPMRIARPVAMACESVKVHARVYKVLSKEA